MGYFDTEQIDETGKHKLVTHVRRINNVKMEVIRPMTLGAKGKWRMAKADRLIYEENLRVATREARDLPWPFEIARIRKRLGLSQREASLILGGGIRSFQKYENGSELPSMAMANLLRLLDHNPDLLNFLRFEQWR